MLYDALIVGGGPAGLSAALTLGRARKRVLLCDAGPRRNQAATHIHNFVTRDGTPPEEFRRVARAQLARYPNVTLHDAGVTAIDGARGDFRVDLGSETVTARRVMLCTGMIDEPPSIEGLGALWGRSVFQCPYCHGWESQDRPWGYLAHAATAAHLVPFALQMLGWTQTATVFTHGAGALPDDVAATLTAAGVRVQTAPIVRLAPGDGGLVGVVLEGGETVACEALFVHPPQRQVGLVDGLGLARDAEGYVQVDPMRRETSRAGVYAAGDLTTRMQSALFAAAAGSQAAAMLNVDLMLERASAPPR